MSLPKKLQSVLEAELKQPVNGWRPLSGGCIHRTGSLETPAGPLFCKWNSADQAANFAAEAEGLHLLAGSPGLRIPAVLARIDAGQYAALVLEYIQPGPEGPEFWEELGVGLATLHQRSHDAFGLANDNFIGSLPQLNGWESDFYSFWAGRRLQPLLQQAWPQLTHQDRQRADRLLSRLPELIPLEPPALLHGDLWRGNLMADAQGKPCLIDPAVYFGHREAEIAFTRLFGGFAPAFYACYQDAFALQDGWRDRSELFNLYPLLAHLVMFGPSYLRQVQAVLKKWG